MILRAKGFSVLLLFIVTLGLGLVSIKGFRMRSTAIEKLRVRIGVGPTFPDPANVSSTGKWYFLDHVSTGLVRFDLDKGSFVPALAEGWEAKDDGTHLFHLNKDAVFHDGTPITARDAEASIKRLLIKKTSTHFPLWEYIEGCELIKTIDDDCVGVRAIDDHTLSIHLKVAAESFYLQMASPETAIWWRGDLLKAEPFVPTKFSGPYSAELVKDRGWTLLRNPQNPISKLFPNSPKEIDVVEIPTAEANSALISGKIDLFVRTHDPLGEPDWEKHGLSTLGGSASTLVYLQASGKNGNSMVGRDLLTSIWAYAPANEAFPADSFLPMSLGYGVKKDELLSQFPQKSSKLIKVAVPWTYFSDDFLNRIKAAGSEVGTTFEFIPLQRDQWFDAGDRIGDLSSFDYVLIPYAASERYPAVQVRYIAGKGIDLPFDLKKAESPGVTPEKIQILTGAEKWLASKQHAVPLYFLRSQITYRSTLDLGDQPTNDAEIEFWRITKQ